MFGRFSKILNLLLDSKRLDSLKLSFLSSFQSLLLNGGHKHPIWKNFFVNKVQSKITHFIEIKLKKLLKNHCLLWALQKNKQALTRSISKSWSNLNKWFVNKLQLVILLNVIDGLAEQVSANYHKKILSFSSSKMFIIHSNHMIAWFRIAKKIKKHNTLNCQLSHWIHSQYFQTDR